MAAFPDGSVGDCLHRRGSRARTSHCAHRPRRGAALRSQRSISARARGRLAPGACCFQSDPLGELPFARACGLVAVPREALGSERNLGLWLCGAAVADAVRSVVLCPTRRGNHPSPAASAESGTLVAARSVPNDFTARARRRRSIYARRLPADVREVGRLAVLAQLGPGGRASQLFALRSACSGIGHGLAIGAWVGRAVIAWFVLVAIGLAGASGVPGLFFARSSSAGERIAVGMLSSAAALALFAIGHVVISGAAAELSLSWAVPGGALSIRIDALAAFFLVPIFTISALGAIYGLEYWAQAQQQQNGRRLRLVYGLIVAGLAITTVAANGMLFLAGWEVMTLAAFVAIGTEDHLPGTRAASYLYLVATRVGTLCLFAMFALIYGSTRSFALVHMDWLTPGPATAIFVLGLLGFGIKAGVMPLHIWLPSAHAAAPSHVSALMSGVLIKIGIYGLVRTLSLLPTPPVWWAVLLLSLGGVSGVLGVAFAIGQHDIKRLLAYHSIENIGIILLGIGVAVLGRALHRPELVVLGLAGGLLHVWNHGLFKGLLFLSAGAVIHACHTREIDQLGGLLPKMPRTSILFLIGAVAICGLPPLNGFVSELLVYLGLFDAARSSQAEVWLAPSLAAAALALIGGLALAGSDGCSRRLLHGHRPRARDDRSLFESSGRRLRPGADFIISASARSLFLLEPCLRDPTGMRPWRRRPTGSAPPEWDIRRPYLGLWLRRAWEANAVLVIFLCGDARWPFSMGAAAQGTPGARPRFLPQTNSIRVAGGRCRARSAASSSDRLRWRLAQPASMASTRELEPLSALRRFRARPGTGLGAGSPSTMKLLQIATQLAVALLLPPLLLGVIVKVKAFFAGRVGAPLLQLYRDVWKLWRKGSVFSTTTTWVFKAGPVVNLASVLVAVLLMPLGTHRALLSFAGDAILFAYLLALGRFFTIVAALDTGSSFEGMGAAREATFSALAEPGLFLGLMALARKSGSVSLSQMLGPKLLDNDTDPDLRANAIRPRKR